MKQNTFETDDEVFCLKCNDWTSVTIELDEDKCECRQCSECGGNSLADSDPNNYCHDSED